MSDNLSRQQRRILERTAAEVERVTNADRKFFERFPRRQFRFRRTARVEIESLEAAFGEAPLAAPGKALFTIVKNLAPGFRMRAFISGQIDEDGSDAPEEALAILWRQYADRHPHVAEREAAFQRAMRLPGGPLHRQRSADGSQGPDAA